MLAETELVQSRLYSLLDIMYYDFKKEEELGKSLPQYNGAYRYDVLRDYHISLIRNAEAIENVLRSFENDFIHLSYGLKLGSHVIHFLMETGDDVVGIFIFDMRRVISVKQIYSVENALLAMNIDKAIIFSYKFGKPSILAINRINSNGNVNIKYRYIKTFNSD